MSQQWAERERDEYNFSLVLTSQNCMGNVAAICKSVLEVLHNGLSET